MASVRMRYVSTWKDKILDYEIETAIRRAWWLRQHFPWKDKILDYEIETMKIYQVLTEGIFILKR